MLIQASKPVARRINPLRMKAMNTVSLLTLLREKGPLSRSDLARISRLMTMDDFRNRIYAASTAPEIYELLKAQESKA